METFFHWIVFAELLTDFLKKSIVLVNIFYFNKYVGTHDQSFFYFVGCLNFSRRLRKARLDLETTWPLWSHFVWISGTIGIVSALKPEQLQNIQLAIVRTYGCLIVCSMTILSHDLMPGQLDNRSWLKCSRSVGSQRGTSSVSLKSTRMTYEDAAKKKKKKRQCRLGPESFKAVSAGASCGESFRTEYKCHTWGNALNIWHANYASWPLRWSEAVECTLSCSDTDLICK